MNGILLVDKPCDWTSNDVVCKLKGVLHERRVGHSGTLDPMATGLLVVFAGRATRAVQFAENQDKSYSATLRLGVRTDTYDITGNVLSEQSFNVSDADFLSCINSFVGEINQLPPMYSAIKVNGRKLYELARKGVEVERTPRKVIIETINCPGKDVYGDYQLEIKCSKGTYIRSLINDIGEMLGCGACMTGLRRTSCGCYNVSSAVKLEDLIKSDAAEIEKNFLISVDSLFKEYPAVNVSSSAEKQIRCGNAVKCELDAGMFRVYSENGDFLMLGESIESRLVTVKSFFEV